MTWIIVGFALAGTLFGYWQGFQDGRLQGRLDVWREETERAIEDFDREMEALFTEPLRRTDTRHFQAPTTEDLAWQLARDGDRLMEGEG